MNAVAWSVIAGLVVLVGSNLVTWWFTRKGVQAAVSEAAAVDALAAEQAEEKQRAAIEAETQAKLAKVPTESSAELGKDLLKP